MSFFHFLGWMSYPAPRHSRAAILSTLRIHFGRVLFSTFGILALVAAPLSLPAAPASPIEDLVIAYENGAITVEFLVRDADQVEGMEYSDDLQTWQDHTMTGPLVDDTLHEESISLSETTKRFIRLQFASGSEASDAYLILSPSGEVSGSNSAAFAVDGSGSAQLTFKVNLVPGGTEAWKIGVQFVDGSGNVIDKGNMGTGAGEYGVVNAVVGDGWYSFTINLADFMSAGEINNIAEIRFGGAFGGANGSRVFHLDDVFLDSSAVWENATDAYIDNGGIVTVYTGGDEPMIPDVGDIAQGVLSPDNFPSAYAPSGYVRTFGDHFTSFDSSSWTRGLFDEAGNGHQVSRNPRPNGSANTTWSGGGENTLNQDNYGGYITDEDTFVTDGALFLQNQKRNYTDPAGNDPEVWDPQPGDPWYSQRPNNWPWDENNPRPDYFEYTSGWINAYNKVEFNGTQRGVYIEVRAKWPTGKNVWPAIWATGRQSWPPEIDIWEYFGWDWNDNFQDHMFMRYIYATSTFQPWINKDDQSAFIDDFMQRYSDASPMTMNLRRKNQKNGPNLRTYEKTTGGPNSWMTMGFQWTDTEMKWWIDGVLVHTKGRGTGGDQQVPSQFWPDVSMALTLNNGILIRAGDGDSSDPYISEFPNYLVIDYVSIWEAAE
jgi:hypothetical protein